MPPGRSQDASQTVNMVQSPPALAPTGGRRNGTSHVNPCERRSNMVLREMMQRPYAVAHLDRRCGTLHRRRGRLRTTVRGQLARQCRRNCFNLRRSLRAHAQWIFVSDLF
eukprot:7912131-Pyramimonas_sp.AAC.1